VPRPIDPRNAGRGTPRPGTTPGRRDSIGTGARDVRVAPLCSFCLGHVVGGGPLGSCSMRYSLFCFTRNPNIPL
jgi:hypothetical protein